MDKKLITTNKLLDTQGIQLGYYNEFVNEYLDKLPRRDGIEVGFGFVDSIELNGFAFKCRAQNTEFRFATVNHGAILYFHDFFSYLMSRTDILPSIGEAKIEKNLPICFRPPRQFPLVFDFADQGLVASVNPVCSLRAEFAAIMALKASEFLIRHEIAHCTNGHIAYAQFALNEGDRVIGDSPDIVLLRHTLEMDADAIAANKIFNYAFTDLNTCGSFRWSEELLNFPANKVLYPSLIAVHLAFRLLARPEIPPFQENEFLAGTHPHPLIRAHFFRCTGAEIAGSRNLFEDDEWVSELSAKAAMDAETIWSNITGNPFQLRCVAFEDEYTGQGLERAWVYMDNLLNYWHQIRPRLSEFALVPLPLSKIQIGAQEKPENR